MTDGPDEVADDCKAFGLDPALFAPIEDEAGLWPEHLPALHAYLAVADQWRIVMGEKAVWLGLDYTAVQAGFGLAGLTVTPAEWADVQTIEEGARAALNGR